MWRAGQARRRSGRKAAIEGRLGSADRRRRMARAKAEEERVRMRQQLMAVEHRAANA
jgi:hypothetical protein